MTWAQLRNADTIFLVRVAGVAVSGDRVLLHRAESEDFWSLPGGRLQVGETLGEALRREMHEEINADVEVGELLWVIENFFEHRPLDNSDVQDVIAHHEIGFYLTMTVPRGLQDLETFQGIELAATPQEFALEFRWFPRDSLGEMDVRPQVVRERLGDDLTRGVSAFVQRG